MIDEYRWKNTLESYMHFLACPDEYSEDETEPSMNFLSSLKDFYNTAFEKAKTRDELLYKYMLFSGYGQRVVIVSKRFLEEYQLGISLTKISFEFPLVHAERIKFMPDRFWGSITSLEKYGELSFQPINNPDLTSENENVKKLFKNKSCAVFDICRNYTFLMKQNDEEGIFKHGFGSVQVSWQLDTAFSKLLSSLIAVIKIAYEINQLLYRSFYQGYQKGMKKHYLSLSPEQQQMYGDLKDFVNFFHESRWQSLTQTT